MAHISTKFSWEKEWEDLLSLSAELQLQAPIFTDLGIFAIEGSGGMIIPFADRDTFDLNFSFGNRLERQEDSFEGAGSFGARLLWQHKFSKRLRFKFGPIFDFERSRSMEDGDEEQSVSDTISPGVLFQVQYRGTKFRIDEKYMRMPGEDDPDGVMTRARVEQIFNADVMPDAKPVFDDMHIEGAEVYGEYRRKDMFPSGESNQKVRAGGAIYWKVAEGLTFDTGLDGEYDITKRKSSIAPSIGLTAKTKAFDFSIKAFTGFGSGGTSSPGDR